MARRKIRYYSRHYLNIDRYAFDRWLVSLVPGTVEKRKGKVPEAGTGKRRLSAAGQRGRKKDWIQARQLVGADGANSLVRKNFFDHPVKHYVAIQQWYRNTGADAPFYSCVFDEETSEAAPGQSARTGVSYSAAVLPLRGLP